MRRTRASIDIIPMKERELRRRKLFQRPWLTGATDGVKIDLLDGKQFSTEFSHTRFLVPKLNEYKGWALFMDCDMIFQGDIKRLFDKRNNQYAIMVVKHSHKPTEREKMDNMPQSSYHRKNWSSFILWNCGHPANKYVTKEFVNTASGRDMHQFSWLDDSMIGHLGFEYNWIENVSPFSSKPEVIHYTLGGPWFYENEECQNVMFAEEWYKEYEHFKNNVEDVIGV